MRYTSRTTPILCLILSLAIVSLAHAEDAPRRGAMIKRIETRLNALELKPEQRAQVDEILDAAASKLSALRQDADLNELRLATAEVFRETHTRLAGVLTEQQFRQFEASMPRARRDTSPETEPNKPDAPPADMTEMSDMKDTDMMSSEPKSTPAKPAEKPADKSSADPAADAPAASLIDPRFATGAAAPNFTLNNLSGKPVSLSKLRGKPTVLLFGSFTSPTFRDKAPAFDALKKEYRNKANILVVYTREAYPNNEWEVQRNIDEQIRVGQHTTIDERTRLAKLTADGMKLDMDVLIDEMDDGVAKAYDAMPNGCVVIDGQGKIVRKLKWADAYSAKLALDEALRPR